MSTIHYLKTEPREHQRLAIEKMAGKNSFALFMEVGTGKTWVALNRAVELYRLGLTEHVLVVAPSGVQRQWVEDELPKHAPDDLDYTALVFERSVRFERELESALKAPGLKVLAMNIESVSTGTGNATALRFLKAARNQACLFMDESHLIKTPGAKRTKAMWQLARYSSYRMIMSGSPVAKNIFDTYAQYKFLDPNILGMTRAEDFKLQYCVMAFTPFGIQIVGSKNLETYHERTEPYTFRITSAEALDLPPKVYAERAFELTEEQRRLIREIKTTWQAEHEAGRASVSTGATALLRIQQISNGFLVNEDGVRIELSNPRLATLKSLLEEIDGKVIIWCRFHYDVEQICRMLGDEAMHYFGPTSEEDRSLAKRMFLDPNSHIKYLVATPDSMGTGLNLQGTCHHNIYYSNSFNSIDRWQSEGRTWRDGVTSSVFYFDLVAVGSADKHVLRNLKVKRNEADMTLDDYRELFRLTSDKAKPKVRFSTEEVGRHVM